MVLGQKSLGDKTKMQCSGYYEPRNYVIPRRSIFVRGKSIPETPPSQLKNQPQHQAHSPLQLLWNPHRMPPANSKSSVQFAYSSNKSIIVIVIKIIIRHHCFPLQHLFVQHHYKLFYSSPCYAPVASAFSNLLND